MDEPQEEKEETTGTSQSERLKRRLGAIKKRQEARRQYFEYEVATLNARLVKIREREETRSGAGRDA